MQNWIIIDEKGNRRLAKPNEICSRPLIDDSELCPEDGEIIMPYGEVKENESKTKISRERKNPKKHTKV